MSRRLLQLVTIAIGLLTIALAGMQFALGRASPICAAVDLPPSPILDSNLRFFAGIGLGLGGILVWIVPAIERRTALFRAVWQCAVPGGLGRLLSMVLVGAPSTPMIAFTVIELPLAALLIGWQSRGAASATT